MAQIDQIETPVRRIRLDVTINGHSATDAVKPDLLEFGFVDNAGGKADEISLKLMNAEDKWTGAQRIKKGDAVAAEIVYLDWFGEGRHGRLKAGLCKVDEIERSGPPDVVTVKAVSASKQSTISESADDRAWENTDLENVASDIAGKHGLELRYSGPKHEFGRVDQRQESDIAFLHRISEERGLNLKVHDGKMMLYDAREAAAAAPSFTIYRRDPENSLFTFRSAVALKYGFKQKSQGTHKKAEVSYHDPAEMETHTATVDAKGASGEPPSEQALALQKRVESAAEAVALGKGELHKGNKKENTVTIECMGHPALVAGITVRLVGWEADDGVYFVAKAEHKVSPGATVSLELERGGSRAKADFEPDDGDDDDKDDEERDRD